MMSTRLRWWGATLIALVACGGTAIVDGEDGAGGTSSGTGSGTATGTMSGTGAGTGSGTGTGTGSGTGTGTGDPAGSYYPEIIEALFFADCMPAIPPDPMGGYVEIAWKSDADGFAIATITNATLVGLGQTTLQTSFDLTPNGVAGTPSQLFETHDKVPNSGVGSNGCDFCGADEITLHLEVLTGGGELIVVEAPADFGCAF